VRGLIPVTTAGVRDQRQLLDFHRELARWRGLARWGAMATLAGMLVFGLALL
jgi:hypothetical protein